MPTLLCVVRPGIFTSLQYQLLSSLSGRSNPSVAIATVLSQVFLLPPPPKKKDRKGEIFLYVSKLCIYKHSASGLSSCTNVQKMKIGLLQIETENYGRTSKSIQFFTSGSKLVPTKKVHLRNTLF